MERLPERAAVMVVRVWIESGDGGLRARLTESSDLASPQLSSRAAASVDEIVEIVRSWLEAFVTRDGAVTDA